MSQNQGSAKHTACWSPRDKLDSLDAGRRSEEERGVEMAECEAEAALDMAPSMGRVSVCERLITLTKKTSC